MKMKNDILLVDFDYPSWCLTSSVRSRNFLYVMHCAIWYHLYNLKNVKNADGGVLLLVKLQAEICNLTRSNNSMGVFDVF